MSIISAGYIASIIILLTAIVDWRRGVTGLGKHQLTKEHTPDHYWMALVLYLNMALLIFWLSGKAYNAAANEMMDELNEGGVIVFVGEPEE